ncbi:MAG: hypothetical protein ACI4JX_00750, partial [Oscillospiraceae bacterium]
DSAALYRNGEKLCDIDIEDIGKIDRDSYHTVTATAEDISQEFSEGEYTLKVDVGKMQFSGSTNIVSVSPERRFYFPEKVTVTKTSDLIKIPLKNNIWSEETAVTNSFMNIEVMKNNVWYSTLYFNEILNEHNDIIEIPFGVTSDISIYDNSHLLDELRSYFDEIKSNDLIDEAERSEISSMTFEEFMRDKLSIAQAKKGDLCRIRINLGENSTDYEFVYFKMP